MTDRAGPDRELDAAASVHAARQCVISAVAGLASSPLDQQAAAQMREALARADSTRVRSALARLSQDPGGEPAGRVVAPQATAGPCRSHLRAIEGGTA